MFVTLIVLLAVAPPGLPDQVSLKTPTRSFTTRYDLALEGGRIWRKPRGHGEWLMLPPDGLPASKGRLEALKDERPLTPVTFSRPTKLVSISADGDNLIAVSDQRRVYYAKLSTLEWTDQWGPPLIKGVLLVDQGASALQVSHRTLAYDDLDGNRHPVTAGVSTLYLLTPDGLRFADPWLPANFSRRICLPLRDRFAAVAMSASASTLMVMNGAGQVFSRLADFDTLGSDPALPYSYTRTSRSRLDSAVRTLPGEGWRAQPALPGPAFAVITIAQTTLTDLPNDARELRVATAGGYWKKMISASRWTFQASPDAVSGPALTGFATLGPDGDTSWHARDFELTQLNPDCEPALLSYKKQPPVPVYFHETIGGARKGAIVSPTPLPWLGGRKIVEVDVETDGQTAHLRGYALDLAFTR